MMKILKQGFILWILLAGLLFSACQAGEPTLAEAVVETSPSPTWTASSTVELSFAASPTPISTHTPTPPATGTKTRPAPTKTATPTLIPTNTPFPTFDPESVITHTPAPPARCPDEDPNFVVNISLEEFRSVDRGDLIQKALDEGASLRQVSRMMNKLFKENAIYDSDRERDRFPLLDLNGDGVEELVVNQLSILNAIGCDDGDYKIMLDYYAVDSWFHHPEIISVKDMNMNGTPEIVIVYGLTFASYLVPDILEWNGTEFVSLLRENFGENAELTNHYVRALYWYEDWPLPMNGWADVRIYDIDQNGTKELILTDDGQAVPDIVYNFGPWRGQQKVFSWNGLYFQYSGVELTPPEYRFQAVNDADRQFLLGNYERALELYREVIFSDKLDFWSEKRKIYYRDAILAKLSNEPLPTMPATDPNEYANLSAYARYRILLHHLAQGWVD